MSDKAWERTLIMLGSVIAIMIVLLLTLASTPPQVDCTNIRTVKTNSEYAPLPKQCEKGE